MVMQGKNILYERISKAQRQEVEVQEIIRKYQVEL